MIGKSRSDGGKEMMVEIDCKNICYILVLRRLCDCNDYGDGDMGLGSSGRRTGIYRWHSRRLIN